MPPLALKFWLDLQSLSQIFAIDLWFTYIVPTLPFLISYCFIKENKSEAICPEYTYSISHHNLVI